jgi:eukaryotic-like serine/threonine-protein kinase
MTDFASSAAMPLSSPAGAVLRRLGRFELRALLGRSRRTMAWRAFDTLARAERVLVLPRRQPADAAALADWQQRTRGAARLAHPMLLPIDELGIEESWPFVAHALPDGATLFAERSSPRDGEALADIARWTQQAAVALAFAHDSGHAHRDLQPWLLLQRDNGELALMGLEAALAVDPPALDEAQAVPLAQRLAEHDVLALGVLLQGWLAAAPALDEPDIGAALARLVPVGRETIRLSWNLPRPVPEALRAIANRATERQPRLRFRNARTLARALDGWLEQATQQDGDAHGRLIERVRQLGVLPALPGAAARAARLALMERQHTEELTQVVLQDPALGFELLRTANGAQLGVESRVAQMGSSGTVMTVRRSIALLGLAGVRRCALALRDWPGPLEARSARELETLLQQVQHASRLAQALRPAGYDAEIVALVAALQNLGRLLVQYHHPEEMRQLRRLMQPGERDEPGLAEQAAAYAVLGADIDAMGQAVLRWWGMDESVLQMTRRLPLATPVRTPEGDDEMLRAIASAANEAIDTLGHAESRRSTALARVVQRYARVIELPLVDWSAALKASASGASPAISVVGAAVARSS